VESRCNNEALRLEYKRFEYKSAKKSYLELKHILFRIIELRQKFKSFATAFISVTNVYEKSKGALPSLFFALTLNGNVIELRNG